MVEEYGAVYANAYDSLYADKDYASECEMLERAFSSFARSPVESILDLGCGTGNHALALAAKGYALVGVDRSEHMLRRARAKTDGLPAGVAAPRFVLADVRDYAFDQSFDAALVMFNVLGYQRDDGDALSLLRTARRHLRDGGLLVCDFWYGPAVMQSPPRSRHKITTGPDRRIVRFTDASLDPHRQICTVDFRLLRLAGDRLVEEIEERHIVRYFFANELRLLFTMAGLELVHIGGFPDFDTAPGEGGEWAVTAIATADGA